MGCLPDKVERAVGEANQRAHLYREMRESFLKGKIQGVLDRLAKEFPEQRAFLKIIRLRLKEEIGLPPRTKR